MEIVKIEYLDAAFSSLVKYFVKTKTKKNPFKIT